MIGIFIIKNNDRLIKVLTDISLALSVEESLLIKLIDKLGIPIIVSIITTIITLKMTYIREKKKDKKVEYISSIKLFKDLHRSISILKDDITTNAVFLTFLEKHSTEIANLYAALKSIEKNPSNNQDAIKYISMNNEILQEHNSYLDSILITENKLTVYQNEYSTLLYDVVDLLTVEEINAVIQHYNNVIFLNDIKTNVTRPKIEPEEGKFYLLDVLKVYQGNEFSIINDLNLKSCYKKLYVSSGYNRIKEFKKINFNKIVN